MHRDIHELARIAGRHLAERWMQEQRPQSDHASVRPETNAAETHENDKPSDNKEKRSVQ